MSFQISSPAFQCGEQMPERFSNTGAGRNISPPLTWENPPEGTKCFALIAEDIDAPVIGLITHWILYNIPAPQRELAENVPHQASFPDGMMQGRNFYRQNGYMGPSPPFGTHRYYFRIYALDAALPPEPKMHRKKLLKMMENHILGQAQLLGRYSKR